MAVTYDLLSVDYDAGAVLYDGAVEQFDGVVFSVQMAFGSDPLDTSPTWTDVTTFVRGFSTNRGRNSEFVDYSPGTASIRLDNRDRWFDPEYTSGPYFGDLNPMVPVRIQATYSGVTYTLYTGFVQGWPTAYNQSNTDAVAIVQCVDANRLLGNLSLIQSPYVELVNGSSASDLYYPMQESGGVFRPLKAPGTITDYEIAYSSSTQTNMGVPIGASSGTNGGMSENFGFALPVSQSISFWAVLNAGRVFVQYSTSSGIYVDLELAPGSNTSSLTVRMNLGRNVTFTGTQVLNIADGVHHFVLGIRIPATSQFVLYVDGDAVWSGNITTTYLPTIVQNRIYFVGGSIGHFAVWDTLLPATFAESAYEEGTIPSQGELSSARLTRALDDAGWPASFRQIETGVQPVGSYRPESLPVVRYMEQVDAAEQGALFVNAEGEVEFQSRTTAESVQVAALFDDAGTDLPFAGVTVDAHTVDAIRNNVVVNYAYGSTVSTDSGSVAAYGTATQTVDAQLVDDPDVAQAIGDNLLARAKDPRTRITSLQVNMRRDPSNLVPSVAGLDLADDVVVSLTPTGVGDPLWRAVSVQGLSHTVTPQSWDVTMYLAPGPVATNGPLMVLDDDTYGELDNNKLG